MHSKIEQHYKGKRLDFVLAQIFPKYSRAQLTKWLKSADILIDNRPQKPRFLVQGGEEVELKNTFDSGRHQIWQAEDIALNVIYEDDDLLVIDKPAGLVTHPGAGNWSGTLVNGLLNYDSKLELIARAGVVHRLDKDTSGLLVVARTLIAQTALARALEDRRVHREYYAIVHGVLSAGGTINQPIGRHRTKRTKMAVVGNGKEAITHYIVADRFRANTGVLVRLETGRTHQIRVHMSHQKMPLIGDKTYGGRMRLPAKCHTDLRDMIQYFPRQALHAMRLGFVHPKSGESVLFESPLPADMAQLQHALKVDTKTHIKE